MPPAPGLKHPRKYDDAKLASMAGPLTIRIERLRGSNKTPIPLPETEDGQPGGTGWDHEDVRKVEDWLVTEWAGGGLYEITVTDSSSPAQTMTWSPYWDPKEFPERTPPPLAGARIQQLQTTAPQTQQVPRMTAFPNGLPPGMALAPGLTSAPAPATPYYVQAPVQSTYSMQAQTAFEHQERRRIEEENARLRQESAAREREAAEARHKAELDRERQANEARFQAQNTALGELQRMVQGLATSLQQAQTAAQTASKPSELQMLEQRLERERAERENEKRDQALRDMMREMQAAHAKTIEEMNRRFEAVISMVREQGNAMNPMLTLVQALQRDNAEAIKEIARQGSSQLDKFQNFMMNPRDMLAMAKDASAGVDQVSERMQKLFGSVIDIQQKVTENMLAMQPQGSGIPDLIRDGMGNLTSMIERYVGAKSVSERVQAQTQAQVAQAQAAAVQAQAMAQAAANGAIVTPPPAPQQQIPAQTGLSGAAPAQPMRRGNGAPSKAQPAVSAATNGQPKRLGRTDIEWFGPLVGEVVSAREGVAKFLDSLRQNPPRINQRTGQPEGTNPDDLADFIIQAMQIIGEKQIPIPALIDLLAQERFADFMDVLLPDVPQNFRDDVVTALIDRIQHFSGETVNPKPGVNASANAESDEDAPDDDDNDEDTDDDDEPEPHVKNGNSTAKPPVIVKPQPAKPGPKPARA